VRSVHDAAKLAPGATVAVKARIKAAQAEDGSLITSLSDLDVSVLGLRFIANHNPLPFLTGNY